MSYKRTIHEQSPLNAIITIDQSSSTSQKLPDGTPVANLIADSCNEAINELQFSCSKNGQIKDKIYLTAVTYGRDVDVLFDGPISSIPVLRQETSTYKEDGVEFKVNKAVFIEPNSGGTTPMSKALTLAGDAIESAYNTRELPAAVVINISDGMPDNPSASMSAADRIKGLNNIDGDASLVFTAHVDYLGNAPIVFPSSEDELPDEHARFMFRLASELPVSYINRINEMYPNMNIKPGAKAMIFNAGGKELTKLIEIGTATAKDLAA